MLQALWHIRVTMTNRESLILYAHTEDMIVKVTHVFAAKGSDRFLQYTLILTLATVKRGHALSVGWTGVGGCNNCAFGRGSGMDPDSTCDARDSAS